MVCIFCGGKLAVINSRSQKKSNQTWRRRRCRECLRLYTTHEAIYLPAAVEVEHAGKRSPLLPDKLFTEVLLALQDRADCYEAARELTAQTINRLLKNDGESLKTTDISREVAKTLKRFNRRAYLRYLSEHPSLQS